MNETWESPKKITPPISQSRTEASKFKNEDEISTYQFPDPVQYKVDEFFPDCVMTTGVVVRGVFFASNQLLWMK